MDTDDSIPPSEPTDLRNLSPQEAPTANQLVAYNMTRARRARGWTQQEVAERLEKYTGRSWSKASISAAERSWQGGRARKFDADEMLALAIIFDTPMAYFLMPMDEGNMAIAMAQPEDQDGGGAYWVGVSLMLQRVLMDRMATEGGSEFFVRAHAAVAKYMELDWHAPVFLQPDLIQPRGTVFPPGYRFGDPLEEQDWTDEDIAEAQEADAKASEARAKEVERALSPQHKESFLKSHAAELSLQIAEHLDRMGYLRRDSEGTNDEEPQPDGRDRYDEDPPF